MAERNIEGKNMVFLIDPANGSDYDLVVCLTANSYERTANVIDANSKCGTSKLNGVKERTIQIEGNVMFDVATGRVSEADLNNLFENDTPFGWKFGPETPEAGDISYIGTGAIISSLSLSAPLDGVTTFSATIQVNGVPTQVEES